MNLADAKTPHAVDQTTFHREFQANRNAYAAQRDEIRRQYAGQYVALAQGRVVGAAAAFDEALALLHQLQPPPVHYLVFEGDTTPPFDVIDDFGSTTNGNR